MAIMGIFEDQFKKQVLLIHIRGYLINPENRHIPLKDGVAMDLNAWRALYKNIHHINFDFERLA